MKEEWIVFRSRSRNLFVSISFSIFVLCVWWDRINARATRLSFHSILKWSNVLVNIDTQALTSKLELRSRLPKQTAEKPDTRRRIVQPLQYTHTHQYIYRRIERSWLLLGETNVYHMSICLCVQCAAAARTHRSNWNRTFTRIHSCRLDLLCLFLRFGLTAVSSDFPSGF